MAFDILDIDRDGYLNILNLLYLHQGLSPTCEIGKEVFTLLNFYIKTNIIPKGVVRRTEISFEFYKKIIKKSCIVDVRLSLHACRSSRTSC